MPDPIHEFRAAVDQRDDGECAYQNAYYEAQRAEDGFCDCLHFVGGGGAEVLWELGPGAAARVVGLGLGLGVGSGGSWLGVKGGCGRGLDLFVAIFVFCGVSLGVFMDKGGSSTLITVEAAVFAPFGVFILGVVNHLD